MTEHKRNLTDGQAKVSRHRPGLILGAVLAALSLMLVACSSGNDAGEIANPDDLQASAVQVEGSNADLVAKFPVPSKAENLSTNDLKEGEGAGAEENEVVQTKYWMFSGTSGELIDSTENHTPEGIPFLLSPGGVIDGFAEGLVGIKKGGERVIVIPPSKAYGENPPGPGIAKNDTLIAVVIAVEIKPQ